MNANTSTLLASINYMQALNTSAIAVTKAHQPYISDIFLGLAGMKMTGYTDDIGKI